MTQLESQQQQYEVLKKKYRESSFMTVLRNEFNLKPDIQATADDLILALIVKMRELEKRVQELELPSELPSEHNKYEFTDKKGNVHTTYHGKNKR